MKKKSKKKPKKINGGNCGNMEEEKEVKAIKVDFKCPNCLEGYLRPTGIVLTSYPAHYPHICNRESGCGYRQTFEKTYPFIDYR